MKIFQILYIIAILASIPVFQQASNEFPQVVDGQYNGYAENFIYTDTGIVLNNGCGSEPVFCQISISKKGVEIMSELYKWTFNRSQAEFKGKDGETKHLWISKIAELQMIVERSDTTGKRPNNTNRIPDGMPALSLSRMIPPNTGFTLEKYRKGRLVYVRASRFGKRMVSMRKYIFFFPVFDWLEPKNCTISAPQSEVRAVSVFFMTRLLK